MMLVMLAMLSMLTPHQLMKPNTPRIIEKMLTTSQKQHSGCGMRKRATTNTTITQMLACNTIRRQSDSQSASQVVSQPVR